MRCVHCGKEIRDGVIFCIHCDRPAKWEYAHYACEFYPPMSITERLTNVIKSFLSYGSNSKDFGKFNKKSIPANFTEKAKQKLLSAKDSYGNYLKSISSTDSSATSDQVTLNDLVDAGKDFLKFLSR